MGQDVGLKCENNSRSRAAEETMRSSCQADGEKEGKSRKARHSRYHQLKCSDGNLGELHHNRIPNFHCKSLPSRHFEANPKESPVHRRGSMYQSSSEISRIRKLQEGRRKIDSSYDRDAFMSFDIVDSSSQPSTSGAYLFSQQNRSSKTKYSVESDRRIHQGTREFRDLSFCKPPDENLRLERPRMDCNLLKDYGREGLLEISLEEEITKGPCTNAAHFLESSIAKGTRRNSQQSINLPSTCQQPGERVLVRNLPKSLSAKVGLFDANRSSESVDGGSGNSSKARSSPFKKMLNPIMKSKSLRNSSLMEKEDTNSSSPPVGGKNGILHKSLLSDFSRTEQNLIPNCQPSGKGEFLSAASSPAHLHAILKLELLHGILGFEFCTEGPEESIYARTWKTGNELNWIYTFHSSGKRASAVGRTSKDKNGCSPPIVGQMQVSSYLCAEVGEDSVLNNSAVTEFVLYDIAHARRSFAVEEKTQCTDSIQPALCVDKLIYRDSIEHQTNARHNSDASTSCLWSPGDLHPHLEVAATVIKIPFDKTKSKELKGNSSPGSVKVVTPSGAHGLPCDDEASPSPLLDRWRYGGGCDCGGWDMACPIVVLDNAYDSYWADSVKERKQPMELFVQGNKEGLPALSMTTDGKGQFLVDFHARLSALQAFSVCISLLHCSEASSAFGIEKCKHKLYSSSLKILLEEEVRQLIEAVTAKEKKKSKKRKEKAPPSVVINPPVSPMGRV